ncbi:transferrin [Culicoides brevitarsis]|uniref:transferrin n=1 Tax=Culicoides brevitarsis TaxID=469753 RepID=UPI00307C7C7F
MLLFTFLATLESKISESESEKLRICVVEEPEDVYNKRQKYCETLKMSSKVSCIWGVDRLDCIRRVQKGQADFSVFSSEDLLAARWAAADILVTSELRYHNSKFEYDIVAVVDNEAKIHSVNDLRGAKYCHGHGFGLGMKSHWTKVISNYLEAVVIPRDCSNEYTMSELRIKASSEFFGPSCKAGIWDEDPVRDKKLKNRYPNLCQLCYNKCDIGDKHWGRRGSLYCLTSGGGDISFSRLDDVKVHFGLTGTSSDADPNNYSFLCLEGGLQPLNTTNPCTWVTKPWSVIAARRKQATRVQSLMDDLIHTDVPWKSTFLLLVENYYVNLTNVDIMVPIDDYIDESPGYQSAYSFPQCNPPRSIVYCTTSIVEFNKCSWLQEVSAVQGIEPGLQCIRKESVSKCMEAVLNNAADVVRVMSDDMIEGMKYYKLEPILQEYVKRFEMKEMIMAVTTSDKKFDHFNDLHGKSICLPKYMGTAYASVYATIKEIHKEKNLRTKSIDISDFFAKNSCIWSPYSHGSVCRDSFKGENGSVNCLLNGHDVAFITYGTFARYANQSNLKPICLFLSSNAPNRCYINWFSKSSLMVNRNLSEKRKAEIYNSLKLIDKYFGKQDGHQMRLFAKFEGQSNVMFDDSTYALQNTSDILKMDRTERFLTSETIFELSQMHFNMKSGCIKRETTLKMLAIFLFCIYFLS